MKYPKSDICNSGVAGVSRSVLHYDGSGFLSMRSIYSGHAAVDNEDAAGHRPLSAWSKYHAIVVVTVETAGPDGHCFPMNVQCH